MKTISIGFSLMLAHCAGRMDWSFHLLDFMKLAVLWKQFEWSRKISQQYTLERYCEPAPYCSALGNQIQMPSNPRQYWLVWQVLSK
jgi:hypothetical protein